MTSKTEHDKPRLELLADCLRGRRSISLFDERPVETDTLLAAIDVARWAPNHHVTQPWHFYILGSKARARTVELTRTITTELRDAEVGERKAARWAPPRRSSWRRGPPPSPTARSPAASTTTRRASR